MCPACITTVVLIVAGAAPPAGLTALVVRKLLGKTGSKERDGATHAGADQDEPTESRVAR
jgi:hypothetical protein